MPRGKYFDFTRYAYYALIVAEDEDKAEKLYGEAVADVEPGDGPPDELEEDVARHKIVVACAGNEKALAELEERIASGRACVLIIDADLI
jgi:hypothetical protein